jgi:hypothetical protein
VTTKHQGTNCLEEPPVSGKSDREGLSIWYRIGYRIQWTVWHVMGPAQLGGDDDPHVRLQRRRDAKVAAARAAREAREARGR